MGSASIFISVPYLHWPDLFWLTFSGWSALYLYFHDLTSRILVPLGKDVVWYIVVQTKRLQGCPVRQRLRLIAEIEAFQIFITVHAVGFRIPAAKVMASEHSPNLTAYDYIVRKNNLGNITYPMRTKQDCFVSQARAPLYADISPKPISI